jgi:hypothetical protein
MGAHNKKYSKKSPGSKIFEKARKFKIKVMMKRYLAKT